MSTPHVYAKDIFQLMFETAAEGMLVADHQGTIRLCNPRISEMFGFANDELVGQKVELLIPRRYSTHHPTHRESFQQHPAKRPMGIGRKLYALRKDGSEFPVEISLNHLTSEGEAMTVALITDISERVQAEERVMLEKNRSQSYLDMAGTLFIVTQENHHLSLINKQACEAVGNTERDAIGKNWIANYVALNDRKKVADLFNELFRLPAGSRVESEFEIIGTGGHPRLVAWHHIVLQDSDTKGILSSGQDITERKAFQEKLQALNTELEERVTERTKEFEKSQHLYSIIARNFPNGTINVLDRNLAYIFVEGRELYKLGITSKNLIGKKITDRLPLETAEKIINELQGVFNGEPQVIEVQKKENHYILNAVPLPDEDGVISQILVVENNITAQKKAEQDMQEALRKERQLNELKSRFVSMASHEFRTPLSTILSSSGLIEKHLERSGQMNAIAEKVLPHFNRIRSSVNNLTGILNDFLSLDKLETGGVCIQTKRFAITELAEEVLESFGNLVKKNQHIQYTHTGEEEVELDPQMLRNIINNLISNAIKYSSEGSLIEFTTGVADEKLTVEVRDHGIGIPDEDKAHMFERFFRAKNAINIQGTGLGLNIVKRYTDLMEGTITFESESGKGTVFTISFPQLICHEEKNTTD
ncbi:MAG: PAS domain S-box protein [Flavobacteriales bacterium]|nr:PAS domain S-box protein [Flavobacteriales bacterium]